MMPVSVESSPITDESLSHEPINKQTATETIMPPITPPATPTLPSRPEPRTLSNDV